MFRPRWRPCCSVRYRPTPAQWCGRRFASSAAAGRAAETASQENPVGRLAFDASKAGLQKVDKTHVEAVIRKASSNSAFYKSEQRKEVERASRHSAIVQKQRDFHRLPLEERQMWAASADAVEAAQEATRDFTRRFIHIDLDMFYAAVEEKFDPSLRDRPFAVGSFAMLATSNYIARQYGVRSGMPGFIAKKLCPQLWIQPLHFELYRAEAAAVRAIAATYDPSYVTVGLDELTMDVTDYLARHNSKRGRAALETTTLTAADVCSEFRARVEAATQLTCSGGVAHTAAFAKLASNVQKPNGQHTVTLHTREDVLRHVRDMPVREVPGVGAATEHQLQALGIRTCSDLLARKAELCYLFREKTFAFYLSAGLGLVRTHVDRAIADRAAQEAAEGKRATPTSASVNRSVTSKTASRRKGKQATVSSTPRPLLQKSTGKSVTVSRGLPSPEAFRMRLRQLVKGAHAVLLQQGTATRHLCFTTTDHSFTARSYSATLPTRTADYEELLKGIATLAEPFVLRHREFRLIGVNFGELQPASTSAAAKVKRAVKATPSEAAVVHRYPKRRVCAPAKMERGVASPPAKTAATKKPVAATTVMRPPRAKEAVKVAAKAGATRPKQPKHRVSSVSCV